MSGGITIDLDQLREEADRWLIAQPADRALDPRAIAYFRRRFCLPSFIIEAMQREAEKGRVQ